MVGAQDGTVEAGSVKKDGSGRSAVKKTGTGKRSAAENGSVGDRTGKLATGDPAPGERRGDKPGAGGGSAKERPAEKAPARKVAAESSSSKNGQAGQPRASSEAAAGAATGRGARGRRLEVRRSGIHGKGVFAARPIDEGDLVIEYTGEVITWKEALRRHPHDPADPNHTFYFHIDDGHVIDGKHKGNAAKWINHSCDPNCEADEQDGRVFVKSLRRIEAGEELNYDYALMLEGRHTPKVKKEYECRCGSQNCRGTMLAPKR